MIDGKRGFQPVNRQFALFFDDTGIIDEDMQLRVTRPNISGKLPEGLLRREITKHQLDVRVIALLSQGIARRQSACLVSSHQHDGRAFARQFQTGLLADPARSACYQAYFAIYHILLSIMSPSKMSPSNPFGRQRCEQRSVSIALIMIERTRRIHIFPQHEAARFLKPKLCASLSVEYPESIAESP